MRPALLIILDGFGLREEARGNAIARAKMPNLKGWMQGPGFTKLRASGLDVGLPRGVMGNSEVGHLALGTGRVVFQSLARIQLAIEDRSFFQNPALVGAIDASKGRPLHLIGLVSDGGVHSHLDHLLALLELATRRGQRDVVVHAILDGRDTPQRSAEPFLEKLEDRMRSLGVGRIADVGGRFFAMDRDQRWDRTRQAFDCLALGKGLEAKDWRSALHEAYARGETDEFIHPTRTLAGRDGLLREGDQALLFNFRPDRMRQLCRALWDPAFQGFPRGGKGPWPATTMATYDATFPCPVAFPAERPRGTLGEAIAGLGKSQLRIAETEKYAHVTYFFNGGEEPPLAGEERILVPSKRERATYDLIPEMAAREITAELERALREKDFALIVCNFANPDMVGHTGDFEATLKACEVTDECLGRLIPLAREKGYEVFITADHGNAELMEIRGQPHKSHTMEPVPLVYLGSRPAAKLREGGLSDVAPTILDAMGLAKPEEMTGKSLFA